MSRPSSEPSASRLSYHLLPEPRLFLKAFYEKLCFMSKDLVQGLPRAMKLLFFV